MIHFDRIKIQNFLIIQEAEIEFRPGIFQIRGHNLDQGDGSNGSGKSSIIEALLWCLYGRTIRGYTADDVVNATRNSNCMVHVDFTIDDDVRYRVARYRKHEEYQNRVCVFEGDTERSLETLKDSQALIDSILGVDFQAFTNYVVFGQGESRKVLRFSEMTDLQRKETLEALLPTRWMTEMGEQISKELNQLNRELATTLDNFNSALLNYHSYDIDEKLLGPTEEMNVTLVRDQIRENLEAIQTLKLQKRTAEANYKKVSTELTSQKTTLSDTVARIKNKIAFFKQNTICPECGTSLTLDYRKSKVTTLVEEKTLTTTKLGELSDNYLVLLETEINSLDSAILEIEQEKNKKSNALSLYEKLKEQQKERERILAEKKAKYKEVRGKLIEYRQKVEALRHRTQLLEFWRHAFSPKGIRSTVLDSVIDYFSERANEYVRQLSMDAISLSFSTHRKKGEKTIEKLEIIVENSAGTPSYAGNSGGERQRIDLAVLFAIMDVANLYSKVDCNIIFLDEIFRHLDSVGIECVKNLLDTMRGKIETIFVVTYLDMTGIFDGVITLKRENNVSILGGFDGEILH